MLLTIHLKSTYTVIAYLYVCSRMYIIIMHVILYAYVHNAKE